MLTYATATNTLITLAGLGNGAARESRAIDNTSTRYDDVLFNFWYQTTGGAIAGDKAVHIYFYGGNNNGQFPSMPVVTGTDAAIVIAYGSSYNIGAPLLVNAVNTLTTLRSEPTSVGQFFGGNLPAYWGFIVYNATSLAFEPTEGNHGHSWTGLYYVGT